MSGAGKHCQKLEKVVMFCPRRLMEKPGGYDPLDARSSRAGDTAAVAELAMQRLVAPPDAGSSPVSRLNIMN